MPFNFDYVFSRVALYYGGTIVLGMAYFMVKWAVAENKRSQSASLIEIVVHYSCAFIVSACTAYALTKNSNESWVLFFIVSPVLAFAVNAGHSTKKKDLPKENF